MPSHGTCAMDNWVFYVTANCYIKKKAFWFTSYNLEPEIRQVKVIFYLKIAEIIIRGPGT